MLIFRRKYLRLTIDAILNLRRFFDAEFSISIKSVFFIASKINDTINILRRIFDAIFASQTFSAIFSGLFRRQISTQYVKFRRKNSFFDAKKRRNSYTILVVCVTIATYP